MKIAELILSKLARKEVRPEAVDVFEQRLAKMTAPVTTARNRRARAVNMPSAFRGRAAAVQ